MKTFRVIALAFALLSAAVAHAQSQRGFSVVLLLGETQSATTGDSMPPAPALRKALNDVKDFLPYKSYRVLDTQWLRAGSTRMKGLDDQEYDVDLVADSIAVIPGTNEKPNQLNIFFRLQEQGAAADSNAEMARTMALDAQRASIQARLSDPSASDATKKQLRDELARLTRLAHARRLIDSHFQMEIGETVVVGTSRIGGGDKGLVVLLTSVAGGK
jgi:hypothetical protein